MLVVQSVQILWTKATRGAPGATERARLPRAFNVDVKGAEFEVQRYRIAEWERFSPTLESIDTSGNIPDEMDGLRISRHSDGTLTLNVLERPDGRPLRRPGPIAVRLARGEFAQLSFNARHSTQDEQHYSESIYNVAYGEHISRNRFLAASPDHLCDFKVHLL